MSKTISFLPLQGQFPYIETKIQDGNPQYRLQTYRTEISVYEFYTEWYNNLADAALEWNDKVNSLELRKLNNKL